MKKRKIIIADNNKHFREGLRNILLNIGDVKIVAEVTHGYSLLNALEDKKADIVFTEVEMPVVDGIELIRLGNYKYPHTRFIAFSTLENKRYVEKILEAGASGYLFKSSDNHDLFRQIIESKENELFLSKELEESFLLQENTLVN